MFFTEDEINALKITTTIALIERIIFKIEISFAHFDDRIKVENAIIN
jgi:hypothetical protein